MDAAVVMEELDLILASPHFRNSKRYPALLRFVVERTLEGRAAEIKERSIAVDVFGREADYDPGVDPVVRVSAGEVRKRLAQYYQEPGHGQEVRIELPVGSYQPEFHAPSTQSAPASAAQPSVWRRHWWRGAIALAVMAALVLAIVLVRPRRTPTALEQFWRPAVSPAGSTVMICFAASKSRFPGQLTPRTPAGRHVAWSDAETLARLAGVVQAQGATLQLIREDQATFEDFQQVPAILIGAFNDSWTLRLMEKMRFTFHKDGDMSWIADRENPGARRWKTLVSQTTADGSPILKEDFAVVSRVSNPRTGRITITVAGLHGYGTLAAGKFLTDQVSLEKLARSAPRGWQDRNMQIVIGTEVIQENSGPPRILATAFW
jgi:hypothetical protein